MRIKRIKTVWAIATYDVWGNAEGGYEVNDVYRRGEIELRAEVEHNNVGTEQAFTSASLSDREIRKAFGVRCQITVEGDDLTYYVNRSSNGYPIGELRCVSHSSLSPIRELRQTEVSK